MEAQFGELLLWKGATLKRGSPQWQRLDNHFGAFLYGAHFNDADFPPVVRIVGLAMSHLPYENVTCYFYDRHDGPISHSVSGRLYHFRGANGYAYTGAFVDCPIPSSDEGYLPFALSVSKDRETEVTNYIIVHYSHNDQPQRQEHPTRSPPPWQYRYTLTRCFPAVQWSYNSHQALAEVVAASLAVGVQRFVFYVRHAGPLVLRMLQVLETEGLAEVYPWNLQMRGDLKGVYYSAQSSSIQDCLYRHLRSSRYVLFGDLDEVFVPRTHHSLLPLLNQQFDKNPTCGEFLFRNVMFNLNLKGKPPPPQVDPSGFSQSMKLITMTHVTRESQPWPLYRRSKMAVVPHRVVSAAVHFVQDFRSGFGHCEMAPHLGLLHHYRRVTRPMSTYVNDTRLHHYANDIIGRTKLLLDRFSRTASRPYP
ncbi:hypothetical protein ACOMHN_025644 [Nucella lapillus]